MKISLQRALQSDLALSKLEERLTRQARLLYRQGFSARGGVSPVGASQMAAVGEMVRRAANRIEACREVSAWMERQLEKLRASAERDGKKRSWLAPTRNGGAESLGLELVAWLKDERYLGAPVSADIDHDEALRRFWSLLHGIYRYEAESRDEMLLSALDLVPEGSR